ncbi:hypothetical protein C7S14_8376 [Burkholderia cepacia]|nr:hypothetical protein C7S14_8376 [Burkholderia cepacia]
MRPVDVAWWPPVLICDSDAKNARRMTAARAANLVRTRRARPARGLRPVAYRPY